MEQHPVVVFGKQHGPAILAAAVTVFPGGLYAAMLHDISMKRDTGKEGTLDGYAPL